MRRVFVPAVAVALLAMPAGGRADEQNVQSLVDQLRPRNSGQPITTRGLPRPGAAAPAPAEHPATHAAAPAARPAAHPAAAAAAPATPPTDVRSADLNVQFASGSATLTPAATRLLDVLGQALTDPSMGDSHFLIEGHTDTVGDHAANLALSERRAAAVVDYLISRFHIPADRLTSRGVGPDALLVPTPDQTPEPRNRRVHVVNQSG